MEEKIIFYINTHYAEPITLESVAESVGFSKFYVSRRFRNCTQYNFCDYLNRRRIKAAEEMLIQTNFNITYIALQVGFQSIASFNRTFKQINGCSPSAYRKNHYLSVSV